MSAADIQRRFEETQRMVAALLAEVERLNRLLSEAAEELPEGLTRSERAQRDEWLSEVETFRREGWL